MLIQFDGSGEGADESPDVDGGGEYFKFTVLNRADVLGLDLCDLCDLMNIESQRFPCLSEPFRYRGHLWAEAMAYTTPLQSHCLQARHCEIEGLRSW